MSGALEGVRVLDLSFYAPGRWATMILADMGADVVCVEVDTAESVQSKPLPVTVGRRLQGKVTLVTGSGRNMGRLLADSDRRLHQRTGAASQRRRLADDPGSVRAVLRVGRRAEAQAGQFIPPFHPLSRRVQRG